MSQPFATMTPQTDAPSADMFAAMKDRVEVRLTELVPLTGDPSRAARHSLLAPGKRLRAILTMLAAEQAGGAANNALDTACAIEMVHTASLIFDDLPAMDDAALRRGEPTSHVLFGDDVAILAGIGLLNGAYGVVSHSDHLGNDQKANIVRILSEAIGWEGLVQGQALDLKAEDTDDLSDLDAIHYGKTGALFVAAVLAGGETVGLSDDLRRNLIRFGRELGFAYQAFDDVLDLVVDEKASGKTAGRDEGKLTAICTGTDGQKAVDQALDRARGHITNARDAASSEGSTATPLAQFADRIRDYFENAFNTAKAEAKS